MGNSRSLRPVKLSDPRGPIHPSSLKIMRMVLWLCLLLNPIQIHLAARVWVTTEPLPHTWLTVTKRGQVLCLRWKSSKIERGMTTSPQLLMCVSVSLCLDVEGTGPSSLRDYFHRVNTTNNVVDGNSSSCLPAVLPNSLCYKVI